jgi:hypothetical protein
MSRTLRSAKRKRSDAPLIRDCSKHGVRNGPGFAAHHVTTFVLRRARDTEIAS